MAGRPRCPVVPPRHRGSARPRERGGRRIHGSRSARRRSAEERAATQEVDPAARNGGERAAAQGARDPGGGGGHGGDGGGFRGRRPEGRRAARIRDGGTRRSAVPRPRRPGEVAGALPPSLAQLRRATAARDLTEREDGGKGEREKGAERGEGEKGRREWRKKKGVISLRGSGSTVSCETHGQPHIQHRGAWLC